MSDNIQKESFNKLIAGTGTPDDSDIISGFRSFDVPSASSEEPAKNKEASKAAVTK